MRRVGGAPRFRELVVYFGEEGGRAFVGEPDAASEETTRPACCEMAPQTIRARARSTAFDIMRMTSSSALSLALHEADDGKRAGSVTEPDNSSASETARERLSSSSLSLTPNEIMSLTAAEGC